MKTVLEAVPPELHKGEAAVDAVVEKVAAVQAGTPLDAVNIPEIHEEPSRSSKGERRQPFAPRMAPRDLARIIHDRLGLECMINHVVVHHQSEQALVDWARETWESYGIRQFVLVGGGRHSARYPGPGVPEANQLLRERADIPALRIGNICIPSREDEAQRVAAKVATGADFFTTQILYEPEGFTGMLDTLAEEGGAPPEILLAFCPVRSVRNLRFLLWLGVSLSDALEQWLTAIEDAVPERSLAQIRQAWAEIIEHQQARGREAPILGVNLAPIGPITAGTTIDLAADLAKLHGAGSRAV
ncbi:mycobacterial-type methylenetetrahydrofolate reductase [Spiribacter insolitus]|uniref:Mycobacterial-type methylenetetrahydrofolate reductase n=1 Tax=Spiribacter insolitus TaxID=3122417 RepID=A0ABV3TBG5_9GAMM